MTLKKKGGKYYLPEEIEVILIPNISQLDQILPTLRQILSVKRNQICDRCKMFKHPGKCPKNKRKK